MTFRPQIFRGLHGEGSMADRSRRFTVAAIALPFSFLAISGRARANLIFVNTLDGGSDAAAGSRTNAGGMPMTSRPHCFVTSER